LALLYADADSASSSESDRNLDIMASGSTGGENTAFGEKKKLDLTISRMSMTQNGD
jgi:hypothetical protein